MAAQKDAGLMAPAGRPEKTIGVSENPINPPITLSDIGIDKNLAQRFVAVGA